MRQVRRLASLAVVFTLVTGFIWSDGARRFLDLVDQAGGGASAEVVIESDSRSMPRLRNIGLTAYGLRPSSVYSVWFSSEKGERSAAGIETNHFRTDGAGKGRYVTMAYEDVIDDWRYLDVMHHPDGDPKNTAAMTLTLRGDLVYGTRS